MKYMSLKNMTEEEKKTRKKEQKAKAQKKYYESHKEYYKNYSKQWEKEQLENKDKEIDRLNTEIDYLNALREDDRKELQKKDNIINELEKDLNEAYDELHRGELVNGRELINNIYQELKALKEE